MKLSHSLYLSILLACTANAQLYIQSTTESNDIVLTQPTDMFCIDKQCLSAKDIAYLIKLQSVAKLNGETITFPQQASQGSVEDAKFKSVAIQDNTFAMADNWIRLLKNPADHNSYDKGIAAKTLWAQGTVYINNGGKDVGAELKRLEEKIEWVLNDKIVNWILKDKIESFILRDKIETLIMKQNIEPMLQRIQNLEAQMGSAIKHGDVFTLRSIVSGRRMTVSDAGKGSSVWPSQNRAGWEHLQAEKCDRPGIGDGYNCAWIIVDSGVFNLWSPLFIIDSF